MPYKYVATFTSNNSYHNSFHAKISFHTSSYKLFYTKICKSSKIQSGVSVGLSPIVPNIELKVQSAVGTGLSSHYPNPYTYEIIMIIREYEEEELISMDKLMSIKVWRKLVRRVITRYSASKPGPKSGAFLCRWRSRLWWWRRNNL